MSKQEEGTEYFRWLGHIFEVEKIRKALADGKFKEPIRGAFKIAPWVKHHGLDELRLEDGKWTGQKMVLVGSAIDIEKAAQMPEDLLDAEDVCLFFGWDDPQTGEPRSMMIDGHHRLARAQMAGRQELKGVMIRFHEPKDARPYYRPLSAKTHIMRLRDTSKPRKARNQVTKK